MKEKFNSEEMQIGGPSVTVYDHRKKDNAPLLIQPVDDHDLEGLENEIKELSAEIEGTPAGDSGFLLAAFKIDNWNDDLSPWEAPPVFGKTGFGGKAAETLEYVSDTLLPEIGNLYNIHEETPVMIGGYSLAGLFALWAAYETDVFTAVAAASPSVWFDGWINFARKREISTEAVSLSLGDKEPKTRNQRMAMVGSCIEEQYQMLSDQLGEENCSLEWNKGGHFKENDLRTAKVFASSLIKIYN